MGRFLRRRTRERDWIATLPDPFVLSDVLDRSGTSEALSWLYAGIERGRIAPVEVDGDLRYHFTGPRRRGDRRAGSSPRELSSR